MSAAERPSFPASIRLGRLAGIDVRAHATMLLLVLWIVLEHARSRDWGVVLEGLALSLCVFAVITLHELGHALMARRFGIRTRDITLLPIGGVASLERMPERPREELAVAFAGPMVNVGIAAVLFAVLMAAQWVVDVRVLQVVGGPFLAKLLLINLSLAAFNLVPAFPMDGGRVLRALLALRMKRSLATQRAARLGQGLAIAMAIVGVFFVPTLLFVAVFVWLGAREEAAAAVFAERLAELKVSDAMVALVQTLDADTPVGEALELSAAGPQHDFPVRSRGALVGLLSQEALLRTRESEGDNAPVGHALNGPLTTVEPTTPLGDAVSVMRAAGAQAALVLVKGELAGLLTAESVAERLVARAVPR